MNHHELTIALWNILTKEEIEEGYAYVTYDIGVSTKVNTGSSMVDQVKGKSPFRDHIVGFSRDQYGINMVLDEEGQKLWDKEEREAAAWMAKYGCD